MPPVRPLAGEPLALDLVNTAWRGGDGPQDLLATPAGHAAWLVERGLAGPATPAARRALVEARSAIARALADPGDTSALDRILARGRIRVRAGEAGAREQLEIPAHRRAAWLAARDLLRLLDERPDRLHRCANPECVLWFADATRSGTRRWCSMATCGNRTKARRHHARHRPR